MRPSNACLWAVALFTVTMFTGAGLLFQPLKIALRGCHPRDLIKQALSLAAYLGRPSLVTVELLKAACRSYFVDDSEGSAAASHKLRYKSQPNQGFLEC